MISLEEAWQLVSEEAFRPSTEPVALERACGRRLAEPIASRLASPRFDNSAMDGWAVGSSVGPWQVVGESLAGLGFGRALQAGEAVRIFTGAPIPPGAHGVLPQEDALHDAGKVYGGPVRPGAHVRLAGEEFQLGAPLLAEGTLLGPLEIGLLASQGVDTVRVECLPRVALLLTGDELVEPGDALGPDAIYESNGLMLSSALRADGLELCPRRVPDDPAALEDALGVDADLVLTVGGVSVGDRDYVRHAVQRQGGQIRFAGVAIKPGKPVAFGRLPGDRAWFGLPGNPMSAWVTLMLLVRPWYGRPPRFRASRMAEPVSAKPGRDAFVPVEERSSGEVSPIPCVGSHSVGVLARADGLAWLKHGREEVQVMALRCER